MRRIKSIQGAPESFTTWLNDNSTTLNERYSTQTGNILWSFFKNKYREFYHELKMRLIEDQGFICCYCGRQIENEWHTSIEHVKPKGKEEYIKLIFDFDNLLASCNGSSDYKIHVVQKEDETLESIAGTYKVNIEYLIDVYVNIDELQLFRTKYNIENLSIGDRIVIIPKIVNAIHCDIKKGNTEIEITPNQDNCQDFFRYDALTGKIIVTPKNSNTIKDLGLNNNRYIDQLRKRSFEFGINLQEQLVSEFGELPEELIEQRDNIISKINTVNRLGDKLEPFSFVIVDSLLQ